MSNENKTDEPLFVGPPVPVETVEVSPAAITIPGGTIPTETIYGPRYRLNFFTFEATPDPKSHAEELDELRKKLLQSRERIDAFLGQTSHQDHDKTGRLLAEGLFGGYTTVDVLPELIGLPLSDLVYAWLMSLRPSSIRITRGEVHCDARPWRVTVTVDENDVVTAISQEVCVWGGCGADLGAMLREAKTGVPARPHGGVIGHVAGLERVDFQ